MGQTFSEYYIISKHQENNFEYNYLCKSIFDLWFIEFKLVDHIVASISSTDKIYLHLIQCSKMFIIIASWFQQFPYIVMKEMESRIKWYKS